MLSDKVHVLIKGLNACHVGLCVIRKFNFLSSAYALCAPVEISHVYRTSHLAGNCMEACLPALYRLACAFRSKCQMHYGSPFHLIDDAESHIAASLSVHRNASQLAQKPSERTPEKFSLDHAVRLAAH